jgi:hypothetical protein
VGKVLSETALEEVKVTTRAVNEVQDQNPVGHWKELWPEAYKQ